MEASSLANASTARIRAALIAMPDREGSRATIEGMLVERVGVAGWVVGGWGHGRRMAGIEAAAREIAAGPDGWRRVVVRAVDTYELAGKPGTCACCAEPFDTHSDDELLECAVECEGYASPAEATAIAVAERADRR
jgi:hypothetical protein